MEKIWNKNQQQGFSLIELMVVLAIIGILIGIGVPNLKDHIVRAKVTEMITVAEPAKLAVTEALMMGTAQEKINNQFVGIAEIKNKGKIQEMTIHQGKVQVIANSKELGLDASKQPLSITLTPDVQDTLIQWTCTSEPADYKKYLPEICRNH